MTQKQYRHASRILRSTDWGYTVRFFRSYPDRLETLQRLENQRRDQLADREYLKQIEQGA
jgi:hypothetical protein